MIELQIEQEVEGIREAHRILEASTVRREGLEKALRVKLEQEIWRLKEEGIKLKGECSCIMKCVFSGGGGSLDPRPHPLTRREGGVWACMRIGRWLLSHQTSKHSQRFTRSTDSIKTKRLEKVRGFWEDFGLVSGRGGGGGGVTYN